MFHKYLKKLKIGKILDENGKENSRPQVMTCASCFEQIPYLLSAAIYLEFDPNMPKIVPK